MELKLDNHQISDSWGSATTWSIASGSLVNSLTFETPLSPIEDDDVDVDDIDSKAKTPLVLQPPSLDSTPCEITFNFKQKHEVQQVYVRSIARVYEIYYAADFGSANEYLCTVHCGIATRDEQVLCTTDAEDVLSVCSKVSADNLSKESLRTDSNLNSSEDDWVEVPDNSMLGNKENATPLKFSLPRERSTQDFYEATAEMSDVNPCVSLTIRLLSLQSKDRVYVDEVYVFADPVNSTESEKQVSQGESSSKCSFMTMLLPTLLQLSKTKDAMRSQENHTSDTCKKQNIRDVGSEAADSATFATKVQQEEKSGSGIPDGQEVKFQNFNRSSLGSAQLESSSEVLPNKVDSSPNNRVERSLDELFSRMGSIENICLRLEEKLLKPINSIEERLQRVEQQLEVLTSTPKNSGFPSCSRFSAPNFSSIESDSTSFFHNGNDYPNCEEFESNKKDIHSNSQSIIADDMSDSGNAPQLPPGLIVTAPEFSYSDNEEENDESNEAVDSLVDKPRQALTVDDALASALAGFVSSISIQSDKNFQSLSVDTPEDSLKMDGEVGKSASVRTENTDDFPTKAFSFSSLEDKENMIRSIIQENSDKIVGSDEQSLNYELGEKDESWSSHGNDNDDQAHHDMAGTDICQITKEIEKEEVITEVRNASVLDETNIQSQVLSTQTDINPDTIQRDDAAKSNLTLASEATEEKSEKDILQNMFEFSRAASMVDFHIPVLDVKFVSQDNSSGYVPLEDLLSGFSKSKSEPVVVGDAPCTHPKDELANLIAVEDERSVGDCHAIGNHFSMDANYCSLYEPLSLEGESMLNQDICISHETFAPSLI